MKITVFVKMSPTDLCPRKVSFLTKKHEILVNFALFHGDWIGVWDTFPRSVHAWCRFVVSVVKSVIFAKSLWVWIGFLDKLTKID